MPIIKTVTLEDFRDAFIQANRGDQFSYGGLVALYGFLEEVNTDHNFELDVIALCCDFTEFESEDELLREKELSSLDDVMNYTILIETSSGGYIIQDY